MSRWAAAVEKQREFNLNDAGHNFYHTVMILVIVKHSCCDFHCPMAQLPDVVRHHAVGHVVECVGRIDNLAGVGADAGLLVDGFEDGREEVRVVVRHLVLHTDATVC